MAPVPIYCVLIFETVALVGRVFGQYHGELPSGTRRIDDFVKAFPRWQGERLKHYTTGTREELLTQEGVAEWLHPKVLDKCDADRTYQQEVELPGSEE